MAEPTVKRHPVHFTPQYSHLSGDSLLPTILLSHKSEKPEVFSKFISIPYTQEIKHGRFWIHWVEYSRFPSFLYHNTVPRVFHSLGLIFSMEILCGKLAEWNCLSDMSFH